MNYFNANPLYQVAEVQLIYRNETLPENRIQVNSAETAYQVLKHNWDMNRIELVEQFKVLLLDHGNNCLGISEISTGSMHACLVDFRIVLATALKARASKLIPAHNHPSGSLKPSDADIKLTDRLIEAGMIIDIAVVDHLILTAHSYYSFADNGLMP